MLKAVEAAEKVAKGATSLIHVMDSEADDYEFMNELIQRKRRMVIRLGHDRRVAGEQELTREFVAKRDVVCIRDVNLALRKKAGREGRNPARKQREATLTMSATPVTFRRPAYCRGVPPTISVNIVAVEELDPPEGVAPVEWLLITTEPINTEEQILKVVDAYRGRWRIEEFFKALKTGCAIEARQLDSLHTLLNALALFIPIAWNLLHLRTVARDDPDAPARSVLSADQLTVLSRASRTSTFKAPLPKNPTARDILLAIARLGGHLSSNGEPGWQILGSGYQELLTMVAGYRLAMTEM